MDQISNLPDNVLETTLSDLPLEEIVRTSVLSHSWRYKWCTFPQLKFELFTFPRSSNATQQDFNNKLARIVDQVLLAHHGPIHGFMLTAEITSCPDIDRWISFLSRRDIKEFTVYIWKGPEYKLPSSFFAFKNITFLDLYRCFLKPPPSFSGFSKLTVLDFQKVHMTSDGLEFLLSKCPVLQKLSLVDVFGTSLKIKSPTLVEIMIGAYEIKRPNVIVVYAPLLSIASFQFSHFALHSVPGVDEADSENREEVLHIVDVLGNLPSIESLKIHLDTLKEFSHGKIPVKLPVSFPLHQLSIHISLVHGELSAAFCIFRSSLCLEFLEIKIHDAEDEDGELEEDFWKLQEKYNVFNQLRAVLVTNFIGRNVEMQLIEFILSNAPILECLQIETRENELESEVLNELLHFRRRSAKAEISVTLPAYPPIDNV